MVGSIEKRGKRERERGEGGVKERGRAAIGGISIMRGTSDRTWYSSIVVS